jgi:hypothetical protein
MMAPWFLGAGLCGQSCFGIVFLTKPSNCRDGFVAVLAMGTGWVCTPGYKVKHKMSDDDKIFVDASQPAVLQHAGRSIDYLTLQEAVIEWHRLSAEDRAHATIKVRGGTIYTAREIDRLHYGPKPK